MAGRSARYGGCRLIRKKWRRFSRDIECLLEEMPATEARNRELPSIADLTEEEQVARRQRSLSGR